MYQAYHEYYTVCFFSTLGLSTPLFGIRAIPSSLEGGASFPIRSISRFVAVTFYLFSILLYLNSLAIKSC